MLINMIYYLSSC